MHFFDTYCPKCAHPVRLFFDPAIVHVVCGECGHGWCVDVVEAMTPPDRTRRVSGNINPVCAIHFYVWLNSLIVPDAESREKMLNWITDRFSRKFHLYLKKTDDNPEDQIPDMDYDAKNNILSLIYTTGYVSRATQREYHLHLENLFCPYAWETGQVLSLRRARPLAEILATKQPAYLHLDHFIKDRATLLALIDWIGLDNTHSHSLYYVLTKLLLFPDDMWADPLVREHAAVAANRCLRDEAKIRQRDADFLASIGEEGPSPKHMGGFFCREAKARALEFLCADALLNAEQHAFLVRLVSVMEMGSGMMPKIATADFLLTLRRRGLIDWKQALPPPERWEDGSALALTVLRMYAICDPSAFPTDKLRAWSTLSPAHTDWLKRREEKRKAAKLEPPLPEDPMERMKEMRLRRRDGPPIYPVPVGFSQPHVRWLARLVLTLQKEQSFAEPMWETFFRDTRVHSDPRDKTKQQFVREFLLQDIELISRHGRPAMAATYVENALRGRDIGGCDTLVGVLARSGEYAHLLSQLIQAGTPAIGHEVRMWEYLMANRHPNGPGPI
jgi:hypothetical protein